MRHQIRLALCAVIVGTVLLSGCGRQGNTTVVLWAHRVDVAAIVELYNAQERGFKIEMRFVPDPAVAVRDGAALPDVIIADSVANQSMADLFLPLGNIIDRGPIVRTRFYRQLLEGGRIGGRQRLLPLSFDLPAVMYRQSPENGTLPEFALHIDEIQSLAAEWNRTTENRVTRMGFAPRWDPEFLYVMGLTHGTGFRESSGAVVWDQELLRGSIEYARRWSVETNGGIAAENAFTSRYGLDPKYQQLIRDRIRFAYISAGQLFRFTDSQRARINFRWIRGDAGIPVLESTVYAGIVQNGRNRSGAQDFLEWLFQPQNHIAILESARGKRIPDFGIAGGFSSIPEVNERHLPRFYPALLGSIPREDALVFPPQVPLYWNAIRREVVQPWMTREVSATPQPRPLAEEIRLWLLQRG